MLYGAPFKTFARLPIRILATMVLDSEACDGYPGPEALASDPVEFVQILYTAAHRCLADSVTELQAGELSARGRAIARAESIVRELSQSLDRERGDLARNLEELYEYLLDRLAAAHLGQCREPLVELKNLLNVLTEEWASQEPLPEPPDPDFPAYPQEDPGQEFIDYDPEPSIEYAGWTKTPD